MSGRYFASSNLAQERADANDPELARRLWEASEKIAAEVTTAR